MIYLYTKKIEYDLAICVAILLFTNFALIAVFCLLRGELVLNMFLKYTYYASFIDIFLAIIVLISYNESGEKIEKANLSFQAPKTSNKIIDGGINKSKRIFLVAAFIGTAMIMLIFYMILK
jgi:hypothetical protein